MADASVSLGLDAASFDNDLAKAGQNLNRFGGAAGRSLGGVTTSGENLRRSNHRVAAQIQHFSTALTSGADASQVFALGLEGLGRSLNLSLGALAGIGVGVAIGQQFIKAFEAAKKLHDEVEKLNSVHPSARF